MSTGSGVPAAAVLLVLWSASGAPAQEIPRGTIIDDVKCAADATQSYALYVPSTYAPDRPWNLLIAFHPGARGRLMVEKYQAAAEQYGYIVAGSNTSRNGPWSVSVAAVQAMSADLGRRFSIDAERVYLTGLSGGARVAMQVALGKNNIAGVIASSAGYPDSQPRAAVPFPVFGTAGTEDFNYIEMRLLDREADLAAPSGGLQRRTHAAAGRGRPRGDRVDGAAGHEDGAAHARRGARRSAVREAPAADRGIDR